MSSDERQLSWPKLLLLFVGFLTVPEIVSIAVFGGAAVEQELHTTAGLQAKLLTECGKALLVALVVWRLGWWRLVLREDLRARPWVWLIPVVLIVTSFAAIDSDRLRSTNAEIVGLFAASMLAVGIAEELLCRGVALEAMRFKHREFAAALLSATLFGLMHLVNLLFGGGAFGQVVVAFFIGFGYYACRRVSGGLLLPILLHALYDFGAFSGSVGAGEPDPLAAGATLQVVLSVLAGLVVLVGYRLMVPKPDPQSGLAPRPVG